MSSKKLAILTIFTLLILGLGALALYSKKMNAVGFRGIGFSVKNVEEGVVKEWMGSFEAVLQRDEILKKIVDNSDYVAKLSVPESEALAHLRSAIDVNYSKSRDTIQLGLRGKRKNNAALDEISRVVFNESAGYVAAEKPAFKKHYHEISQAGQ